jgi:phosphatidylserine decarboxylase
MSAVVPEPIRYFNRYTKTVETERVYGEKWLRWANDTTTGRWAVAMLLRRAFFSRFYGWRMNKTISSRKVMPFILNYGLDADEFAKRPWDYKTFNDFFARALKPGARPIAPGDSVAVLPADGRHLAFPNVDNADGFYAKGAKFSFAELFGEGALPEDQRTLAREFAGGSLVISRLCPVDYHRFHFPVAGTPDDARLIGGWLYSVSPIALRHNIRYLVQNKRMLTLIESPVFGRVAQMEIGATCVGTIKQLYPAGLPVAKGYEKGMFKFGGSCVVTVFQRGRITFEPDLIEHSAQHREVYARMGDRLGVATAEAAAAA